MPDIIKITVNAESARRRLAELADKASNLRPVLVRIAGHMMDAVAETFQKEGRPKWPSLARSTQKARARKGKWPGPILRVSGLLYKSISSQVSANQAQVGTNREYAGVHQFGATIQHPGRAGTVRLRALAQGKLARQQGFPNLAVFAGRRHKRTVERAFTGKPYTVRIPARPFLVLTDSDTARISGEVEKYFGG